MTLPVFGSTVYVPSAVLIFKRVQDGSDWPAASTSEVTTVERGHSRTLVGTSAALPVCPAVTVPAESFDHGDNTTVLPSFALPVSSVAAGIGGGRMVGVMVAFTVRP